MILTYLYFLVNFKGLPHDKKNGRMSSGKNTFGNSLLSLRFTLYFLIINKNKANIQARLDRHNKLNASPSSSKNLKYYPKNSFFGFFLRGLPKESSSEISAVTKFIKRVASISAAFFIISSFSLFDFYFQSPVQGYEGEGTDGYGYEGELPEGATSPVAAEIVDNVITDDGFTVKPNLTTGARDLSTASEVFAYKVEAGDTVSSVAEKFGVKKETIMMENKFYDVNQLKEGMTINLLPVDGLSYVVQKGDTISGIAKKFSIKEEDIVRQNQMEDAPLVPNMVLILPGATRVVLPPAPPKPTYTVNKNGGSKNNGSGKSAYVGPSNYVYSGPKPEGNFLFPVPGGCIYTQRFHGGHYATDCANRAGGTVVAAADGVVIKANLSGYGGGYGIHAIVKHPDGTQTLYAHFKEIYVKEGQTVKQGEALGFMGTTGRSTGVHLHFEIRAANGTKLNPENYVTP